MFLSPWSDGSPVAFLKRAVIEADALGLPSVPEHRIREARLDADSSRAAGVAEASVLSVVIRDSMFRHYFHFIETLLILFATQHEYFSAARVEKIYFGALDWNNAAHADVQRHLLGILFPDAEIVTDLGIVSIPVEHLIYIDRQLGHTIVNKMIDPVLFLVSKWGPALRAKIYAALGIESRAGPAGRMASRSLYVPRQPPRTMTPDVEHRVLQRLAIKAEVSTIEFAGMSWADQVRAAAQHDLMLGVHGNGLTNLLWLPPHAMVIELFPEGVHHYDYQVLSEVMHLDYFGLEADRIFRPFSRYGAPYSHNSEANRPVARLSSDALELALSGDALQRETP